MVIILEQGGEYSGNELDDIVIFCLRLFELVPAVLKMIPTRTPNEDVSMEYRGQHNNREISYKSLASVKARLFHLTFPETRKTARSVFKTFRSRPASV